MGRRIPALRKIISFPLKLFSHILQKILGRESFCLAMLSIELAFGAKTHWSGTFTLVTSSIWATYFIVDLWIIPVSMIPAFIFRFAERIESSRIQSIEEIDGNFALYLRTFRSDRLAAEFHYGLFHTIFEESIITDEKLLCSVMSRIYGKVVALGNPEDRLTFSGARRLYESNKNWRQAVRDLTAKANLVMIQLNEGRWTEWELSHAAKNVPLDMIVLILPRRQLPAEYMERVYEYFSHAQGLELAYQTHVEAIRDSSKPAKLRADKRWATEYLSVICFDSQGIAHCNVTKRVAGKDETIRSLTLAEHLGLDALFRLKHVPDGLSYAGLGCCRIPIAKSHDGKIGCLREEELCAKVRHAVQKATPKWKEAIRPYNCCPQCVREKGLLAKKSNPAN